MQDAESILKVGESQRDGTEVGNHIQVITKSFSFVQGDIFMDANFYENNGPIYTRHKYMSCIYKDNQGL